MCHPNNRIQREKMLVTVQSRRPLTPEEFMDGVRRVDTKAAVAGTLLLTMIQLQSRDDNPSLNRAIPLVAALLPKWNQPTGPCWSSDCHVGHHPHSRENILRAFKEFHSVAHLWAALLHGQQHDRQDIWPGSLETLPNFLAHAEAILDLASLLPPFSRGRGLATKHSRAWRFTIPDSPQITLAAFPLNNEPIVKFSTSGKALKL